MAAHYNFRNILGIDPDNKFFTCAGTNELHQPFKRCQNQILVEDREAASRILNQMDVSSTCQETLKLLPELVSRTLCTETHRSKPELCQIGQVYTEWRDSVRDQYVQFALVFTKFWESNSSGDWGVRLVNNLKPFRNPHTDLSIAGHWSREKVPRSLVRDGGFEK
jgi:hypothetical protein